MTDQPAERLLKLPEVMDRVGLSRPAIYRAISAGIFPRPVKLGDASRWVASELALWIEARMAARDGRAPQPVHGAPSAAA